ncbi:hypothetical protein Sango_1890600 [Sesamum angolense]|uniref:DUF4218 domain-containing protein n=1 Tax=Sesamum angolense TaxID=2727404 RepID=A0AAE1WJB2_9LAMI|nr:hypothetical protein Sango_1890600 [Sesamum angolense]
MRNPTPWVKSFDLWAFRCDIEIPFNHDRKACYFDCYRQFSLRNHPHRRNKKAFLKNHVENKVIRCNRPELELDERRLNVMPKAVYTLTNEQKMRVCEWIHGVKFPDRLLFQSICLTTLDSTSFMSWKILLPSYCATLKIFPPTFFDSIEHLIVHLSYEVPVGGAVQYRWIYPFERFLRELNKKVKNKAHAKESMVKAYIVEEISLFLRQYFESDVQSKSMPCRNDECTSSDDGI